MNRALWIGLLLVAFASFPLAAPAQQSRDTNRAPAEILAASIRKIVDMIDPADDAPKKTFYLTFEIRKAEGLRKSLNELSAKVAFQPPDRAWISMDMGAKSYTFGRNGQQLWMKSASEEIGIIGERGQPRFASQPDDKDETHLDPIQLPVEREKLLLLPFLMNVEDKGLVELDELRVRLLQVSPKKETLETLKLPNFKLRLWLETNDLPLRISYFVESPKVDVNIYINNSRLEKPWADARWEFPAGKDDEVVHTALSHMKRFANNLIANLTSKIPPLAKEDGKRTVIASEGQGRLEQIDGVRVLFLKGTPEEMGRQHGMLLRKQIREANEQILYGLGVGNSFEKGNWFFADAQSADKQMRPFMGKDYLVEMAALASAAGVNPLELRYSNEILELLHCTIFSVYGKATAESGGKLFQGRVLDYLRGSGLEQNAVLMVFEPEGRNAWLNVGYAGLIGSVTAMNEKHLAIGEMGGRHAGEWEGRPMAELVREVMERAGTLDEAVEILRNAPRTCDYSYLISDGKTRRTIGIRATGEKFELIEPGKKGDRQSDPIEDALLISADKRYEELVKRVKEKFGKIGSNEVWEFMKPPVAMDSNIQTVLFAPETLDFRVATADSEKVASEAPFRKFNLLKLLGRDVPAPKTVAK